MPSTCSDPAGLPRMAPHGGSETEMGALSEVTLVKLGGSLLTDKSAVDAVRPEVLARLAAEIAESARGAGAAPALVLAHGSGSFGHVAARRYGLAGGLRDAGQLPGVSLTQERAAALHWQFCAALAGAGLHPFSLAPSSSVVASGGQPLAIAVEPMLLALAQGLLPVLYGDVVLDRRQGVAICSTERLFALLASELPAHRVRVRRVLWLGATEGVYDAAGRTLARIDAGDWARRRELRDAIGGSAGTDVTGGMLHRIETALALAARGIPSLIANGATPGLLAAALRGEPVPGTEIVVS
jgi:isopentenyl phosphate kinase